MGAGHFLMKDSSFHSSLQKESMEQYLNHAQMNASNTTSFSSNALQALAEAMS